MTARPLRVLAWTENYWVGGADRFLADLAVAVDPDRVELRLAGNPHAAFDSWLAERAPDLLPRTVIPIANLMDSSLTRLRDRLLPPAAATGSPPAAGPSPEQVRSPVADTAVAAVRFAQASANYVRLRQLLATSRPDVLHLNNGGYPGGESCRMAALAAKAVGVPRVVHFVHNMAYPPPRPVAVERALDRRVDRATDCWVTAAERASGQLQEVRRLRTPVETIHYGLPDPVRAPGSALPLADLGFDAPGLRVAVVANLEPRKGHRSLLNAVAALRREGVVVRLACVGDGPERTALEALVVELGLREHVRLLGWREDVPAVLVAAEVLCLPSLSNECLPYAILEAMQAGLAVVSTDVAGIPEMVLDGVTGSVVPPGDAGALAAALRQLATRPQERERRGAAGQARVAEHFTLTAMTERMTSLWAGR